MFDSITIESPKRKNKSSTKVEEFFPYYAGFPESFAETILRTANLKYNSVIFDPWNGSGTTTTVASNLKFQALGIDINPVMVIVARARSMPQEMVTTFEKHASTLISDYSTGQGNALKGDPLLQWFEKASAGRIRGLESTIRKNLPSCDLFNLRQELSQNELVASSLYVALFNTCRKLTSAFRSSNPTWLKTPSEDEKKLRVSVKHLNVEFASQVKSIASSASNKEAHITANSNTRIFLGDSTKFAVKESVDLVLTSPPYCTRIDYTAATRIELAVLSPLLDRSREDLSLSMIGTVKVPKIAVAPQVEWGGTCLEFLELLRTHTSKASSGYYYKTHLDYFDKMHQSLKHIYLSLKQGGGAILVVQDSFYKDIYNNLPLIITEMAEIQGLKLEKRFDFHQRNPISGINSKSRKYIKPMGATESVLCFNK